MLDREYQLCILKPVIPFSESICIYILKKKNNRINYLVSCTVPGMCFSDIVWYLIKINIEEILP